MRCKWVFAALLSIPPGIVAQNALPSGTILPVSLDTSLNAAKIHAGMRIRATVMQDIPGTAIRRRAQIVGHVVQAGAAKDGHLILEIRFDAVKIRSQMVPFTANLRALASFMEVEEAQIPEEMSSRGLTPETWTTQQIGGDQFYRGRRSGGCRCDYSRPGYALGRFGCAARPAGASLPGSDWRE
jgi:hypothetical protein